ncbi:MAG TPA: valine--tRNA ligase [Syntrophobacteraceae bacterium]|nr:valine--tRNA ligase [Syntrophobacteraceae bacterium]
MMTENLLPKAYTFQDVEPRWSTFWEQHNLWTADPESPNPPFSIVIPPPNVTGQLHMGHALNNTLQDILCRYHRLKGFEVLWVPGTDHAGIATQNVVERQLTQEGLNRHILGREAFLDRVWDWKQRYGGIIINQLKRLGASCDWSRERFTMDEGLSRAVRLVFVRLYQEGLIYRGKRMINWCPRCMTALANIEVEGEELDSHLYHIQYPAAPGKGGVVVATTRPETMLGDTAVAVHPEDPRYKALVGRKLILPLVERPIPVIGDPYVDREFGTGALKVTPAHDFNDFEIGRKHGLELVQVIGEDGRMNEAAGVYAGLDRHACRKRILKDLEKGGYLVKTESYRHRVGHCYRCRSIVEPMQSLQWFVKTRPLADQAIAAVQEGKTRIVPAKWEKDYFIWLENLEDWCISRQIWWGHRIPAWYCRQCGETAVSLDDPSSCPSCQSTQLEQDPDVLDTWFSSALWPFSTMGWPDRTPELQKFYPTSVLVTAFDILYFWVARMMMMGLHFMGEVPFHTVYVHALVRDAQGQKMSKSKGNVIDPLVTMDQFGTDALRFTLTAFAVQGRDVKLSEERIEGYKHFINKIWNAARLLLMNLEGTETPEKIPAAPYGTVHRWILSRAQRVIEQVQGAVEGYLFNQYANVMYQFAWHEFCDWYLEIIKQDFYGEDRERKIVALTTAAEVFKIILILLHPIMPFVTEEIWQKMPRVSGSLRQARIPSVEKDRIDPEAEEEMELVMEVINGIRNIRGEMNVPPASRVEAVCLNDDSRLRMLVKAHERTICEMARLSRLQVGSAREVPKPKIAAGTMAKNVEVYVLLKDILDFDSESSRLQKELTKLEKEYSFTLKKLSNEDFLQRAPSEVIERERDKGSRLGEKLEKLRSHYERIRTIQASASGAE